MNLQEIFNKVVTHLRTQGEKAKGINLDTACYYRTETGLKCAVGCLIKDEHYNESLEGHSVSTSFVRDALRVSGIELDQPTELLLGDVQSVHDHMDPPSWERCFERIARDFSLTLP